MRMRGENADNVLCLESNSFPTKHLPLSHSSPPHQINARPDRRGDGHAQKVIWSRLSLPLLRHWLNWLDDSKSKGSLAPVAAQQAGRAERQTTVEQEEETLQLPVRTPEFLWGRGGDQGGGAGGAGRRQIKRKGDTQD